MKVERFFVDNENAGRLYTFNFAHTVLHASLAGTNDLDLCIKVFQNNLIQQLNLKNTINRPAMTTGILNKTIGNLTESFLHLMQEALIVLDSSDKVIQTNVVAGKLFGVTNHHELIGKSLSELYHDENEAQNFSAFLSENKCLERWENTFVKANGEIFIGSYSARIVSDDETQSVVKLLLIQDITEKVLASENLTKCAHRLREAVQELNQFTYIVTHDLKAPLRAINNLSCWIEEDLTPSLTEDTSKNLALLRSRVSRMESMINGLSEYSKIRKETVSNEWVDVQQLISEILKQLSPPMNTRVELQEEIPFLLTSKSALSKVFSKLIENAIQYNDKKEGLIKISAMHKGDYVEFTVEDNGPGISAEFQEKIFTIFQTLVPKDQIETTGIGLTIAKKWVELHGGQIKVQSGEGQGAKFIFTWPNTKTKTACL